MDGPAPAGYREALALLDRRIEREILRLRARYQLSLDEFRGLYVSDDHVDALLAETSANAMRASADPASAIMATLHSDARWERLTSAFALSALEQDVLLLALAPEIDLKYETLYAYLNDDVTRKWPTLDLACRLLSSPRGVVGSSLSAQGTLRGNGLIERLDPPSARPSQLNSGFALHPSLSQFLLGAPTHEIAVAETSPWEGLPLPDSSIEALRGLTRMFGESSPERPAIVLLGEAGSGREQAARTIARELRLPFRKLDVAQLRRGTASLNAAISAFALEVRLDPALVCVSNIDVLSDRDGHLPKETHQLLHPLEGIDIPIVVLASKPTPWRDALGRRRALILELNSPDYAQRLRLWRRALRSASIELPETADAMLAGRFQLGPAQIDDAVRTAQDWTRFQPAGCAVDATMLQTAARAQSQDRLKGLAAKVECRAGWNDLILPPAARARLQELCAAIQFRHVVYSDWGFAQSAASGVGVKALFAGSSGTGKTMAAGVIARELGLDLYKVDLAGVVSKYIGETEKNLDRIFNAACSANAVLFFDEADAVFGKRSEVKDAHDRYANVEVAYLLQKLEQHDGVVVLASNFKRNIDDAFARRLHYVVDFPKPDVAQRELLWRAMFPRAAPLDADVDFAFLATQFEICGGDIRNVALDAAFLAACSQESIGMRHLMRAMSRQLNKQGKTATRGDFDRYYHLLDPELEPDAHGHVASGQKQ